MERLNLFKLFRIYHYFVAQSIISDSIATVAIILHPTIIMSTKLYLSIFGGGAAAYA